MTKVEGNERSAPCVAVACAVALAVVHLAVNAVVFDKVLAAHRVHSVKVKLAVALVIPELGQRQSHGIIPLITRELVLRERGIIFA